MVKFWILRERSIHVYIFTIFLSFLFFRATQKVLCCIHEMSSACIDHNDIYATMQLGVDISAMVKDHCPMEEMAHHVTSMCTLPPAPCNTHRALAECYVPITSRDNITGLCQ